MRGTIESRSIAPEAIRNQVDRIHLSEAFARSPRMRRFLKFIVEETLAGREGQLGEYGLGVAVFDRGTEFEPALDPIVRNDARRLRFKLLEYYQQSAQPGEVVIEIPKGGYVPVFHPPAPSSNLDRSRARVAVLPFEVLSAPEDRPKNCGRALCLSLTADLTNMDGLEAIAHTCVAPDTNLETAAGLNLSHVIHGSILSFDDNCQVIVNLIQVQDGAQLWARAFDFKFGDMLEAQAEITRSVSGNVSAKLGLSAPVLPSAIAAAA